jgi:hypothetical protein
LLIAHFSSLYGVTSLGDPEGRLRNFLLQVLRNSKSKVIVYSRWNEGYRLNDGSTLAPMQEFVLKELGADGRAQGWRVQTLDVNGLGLPEGKANWQHPVVIDALKERVRQALDLPNAS